MDEWVGGFLERWEVNNKQANFLSGCWVYVGVPKFELISKAKDHCKLVCPTLELHGIFQFFMMTPEAKASPTPTPKPSFVLYMGKVGTLDNWSAVCDKQTWHESRVHPCSNSLKMASFMFFPGNSQQNSLICLKMGYFMSFHGNSWQSSPLKKGGGRSWGWGGRCVSLQKIPLKVKQILNF